MGKRRRGEEGKGGKANLCKAGGRIIKGNNEGEGGDSSEGRTPRSTALFSQLSHHFHQQPLNIIAHKRIKRQKPLPPDPTPTQPPSQQQTQPLSDNPSEAIFKHTFKHFTEDTEAHEHIRQLPKRSVTVESGHSFDHARLKSKLNQTMIMKSSSKETRRVESKLKRKSSESSQLDNRLLQEKLKRVKEIEKDCNKGPLKEKHMMSWLNQILLEYCFQDDLAKGELKALERFGLDANSLVARGVSPANVFRLYQSLFVHSIGFNNFMREMAANRSVMKALWKVYAVLLEYCSEGNFQTVMGELERDSLAAEARLKEEIEKRQRVIDNNEEIMEVRLHKYVKENKDLKERVGDLSEKLELLEREFREMEVGFNMEVSLRLSYQYKINEIYSVHEKLNILHLNLYKDFTEQEQSGRQMKKDYAAAKERIREFKVTNDELTTRIEELHHIHQGSNTLIEGLQLNEALLKDKLSQELNAKKEEFVELRDKERRIGQLERELASGNLMIKMMKEASAAQIDEYRRLATENMEMRRMNQAQLEKIAETLGTIKELNSKESKMLSDLDYNEHRIRELESLVRTHLNTIAQLEDQLEDKDIALKTQKTEMESQKKMVASMNANLQEIKRLYERMEEENKNLNRQVKHLSESALATHKEYLEVQLTLKNTIEDKFALELEVNTRISEVLTLQKKYESDNYQQNKKYEHLAKIFNSQDQNSTSLADQLAKAQVDLETANFRIAFLSEKFTDLSFEKAKLESSYKDNLVLHEREKSNQKELMIQISTLTEHLEQTQRQLTLADKNAATKARETANEKARLGKVIARLEEKVRGKEGFVHPMLLEDCCQLYQREVERHARSRRALENEVEKETEKNVSLRLELQKKEMEFKQHAKELEKRVERMKFEMESEREYFKQKSQELNALNYELQTSLQYKALEVEKKQEREQGSEQKITELMKEKNQQIQQLLSELERIEDNFQKKCTDYEQEIQVIHNEKQHVIADLINSKKQLEVQVEKIEQHYNQKLIEKEREKDAILSLAKQAQQQEEPDLPENKRTANPQDKRQDFSKKVKLANLYYYK